MALARRGVLPGAGVLVLYVVGVRLPALLPDRRAAGAWADWADRPAEAWPPPDRPPPERPPVAGIPR